MHCATQSKKYRIFVEGVPDWQVSLSHRLKRCTASIRLRIQLIDSMLV